MAIGVSHHKCGHLISDENAYLSKGKRYCRQCSIERNRRWLETNRAAHNEGRRIKRREVSESKIKIVVRDNPLTFMDIAWSAGFLEGEGSFKLNHATPIIDAAQVENDPLDRLYILFGGSIYRHNKGVGSTQTCRIWRLSGGYAAALMMTLYSLMSPKRRNEIEACLLGWKSSKRLSFASSCFYKRGYVYAEEG